MLGSSHLYVFHHPKELKELMKAGNKPPPVTYDQAQGEIATSSGFDMTTEGKSKEDILLQEDLITLMPVVHEANAISEELNKKVRTSQYTQSCDALMQSCDTQSCTYTQSCDALMQSCDTQ